MKYFTSFFFHSICLRYFLSMEFSFWNSIPPSDCTTSSSLSLSLIILFSIRCCCWLLPLFGYSLFTRMISLDDDDILLFYYFIITALGRWGSASVWAAAAAAAAVIAIATAIAPRAMARPMAALPTTTITICSSSRTTTTGNRLATRHHHHRRPRASDRPTFLFQSPFPFSATTIRTSRMDRSFIAMTTKKTCQKKVKKFGQVCCCCCCFIFQEEFI